VNRVAPFFTPKALHSTAQGREALRAHPGNGATARHVRAGYAGPDRSMIPGASQGALEDSRPWAIPCNAFGVRTRMQYRRHIRSGA